MATSHAYQVLLALLMAGQAQAATLVCTSLGDFSWPAVDDVASTDWDCIDADSPGADDHFVVEHEVTVVGDILQDGAVPGTGITVSNGGTLQALQPVTFELGESGLDCQPGSTCRFAGGYREFGVPSPGLLATPDPLATFEVGHVVLCPDATGASDCSQPGLRRRVRLSYPASVYGPGGPSELPHVCAAIATIAAGNGAGTGDVLAFWNPDPLDVDEGPDTNFWYEIESVDASEPCHIDFSVHQGVGDQAGYPLGRREVASYFPSRPVAIGARQVEFAASTLPASDYHDGRMLRLEAGGEPSPVTYRIYDTVVGATTECVNGSGPCDLLRIADHRGFSSAADPNDPDEDEVWIDYGWEPQNPFLVIAPVRIAASAPARETATIRLAGNVSLQGVVFDRTDTVLWEAQSAAICRDVWLRDPYSGTGDKLHIESAIDCERLSITGGDPDAAFDLSHTVVAETDADVTLRAVGLRHGGDDFFSVISGYSPTVVFDRYRAQFKSTNAPSDECIAVGPDAVTLLASDVECIDATNSGANFNLGTNPAHVFSIQSAILIGSRGPLWFSTFGNVDPVFSDVTIIGSALSVANSELLPMNTDRFVVRDSTVSMGRLIKGGSGYARNGIVKDNVLDSGLAMTTSDIEIDNVAFLRTRVTGTGNDMLSFSVTPTASVWRNVLFVEPDVGPVFQRMWRFRSSLTDLAGFTMDGIAFVGGGTAIRNQSGVALDDPLRGVDFGNAICFLDNVQDADAPALAQLPASALFDVDPEFVDPAIDRFEVAPGSAWDLAGCGVRRGLEAPGVRDLQRYHGWSNLVPESMAGECDDGVDNDGDGRIDHPDDPGCLGLADEAETEPGWPCDDGLDNDGDGRVDFDPATFADATQGSGDPACANPGYDDESPECQDGLNNDTDAVIDFDGGQAIHGLCTPGPGGCPPGVSDPDDDGVADPDPTCVGRPWWRRERPTGGSSCGLGMDLAILIPLLLAWRGRRKRTC